MKRPQLGNSFTPTEIKLMKQLLIYLFQGRDVGVIIKNKAFKSLYSKFNRMHEKLNNARNM